MNILPVSNFQSKQGTKAQKGYKPNFEAIPLEVTPNAKVRWFFHKLLHPRVVKSSLAQLSQIDNQGLDVRVTVMNSKEGLVYVARKYLKNLAGGTQGHQNLTPVTRTLSEAVGGLIG